MNSINKVDYTPGSEETKELENLAVSIKNLKEQNIAKLFRLNNIGDLIAVANKDYYGLQNIKKSEKLINHETRYAATMILNHVKYILGLNPYDIKESSLKQTINQLKDKTNSSELKNYISDFCSKVFSLLYVNKKQQLERLEQKNEELKQKNEKLKITANTDDLTGLSNKAFVEKLLRKAVFDYQLFGNQFSLAIFDGDHFKGINDTYGHFIGDQVIKEIALTATKFFRSTDIIARWGGEEFVIILNGGDINDHEKILNNFRKKIEVSILNNTPIGEKVTVSIGVAAMDKYDSADSLFKKADKALYKAKENGRNRVETS